MKKIEDFIHLYLGCKIYITAEGAAFRQDTLDTDLLDRLITGSLPLDYYKPILRPLIDMSEEEKQEMMEQKHKYDTGNPDSNTITDFAYRLHWALNKHFDLFGLIPTGLAIDKTTLTAN